MVTLLISAIIIGLFQVNHPCWLMVFVPTPEPSSWVPFSESGMHFKHFFRTIWLQYDLCILNRILFWDVHREMNMNTTKPKFSKLKSEAFQVPERLGASVDMGLFPETVISFFSCEHHSHPVIAGVMHNFFRGYAIYSFHKDFYSCRVFIGQAKACRTRQKIVWFDWRKKRCSFPSAGLPLCSRPRSILSCS